MIASIISAIAAALRVALAWMQQRRDAILVSLGASKQSNADLQGRIDALQEANRLRNEAESRVRRDGDGELSDDGFQRKDDD